jgi:hypothetical protein
MHIEDEPGHGISEVWAYLSPSEARELLRALQDWAEDPTDPDWHHHITDDGRELTIAISSS